MRHNREQLFHTIKVARSFQSLWSPENHTWDFWSDLSTTMDKLMLELFNFDVPEDWGYDDIVTWCRNELDKEDDDA